MSLLSGGQAVCAEPTVADRAYHKALELGAVYVMSAPSPAWAVDLIAVYPPAPEWLAGVYDGEGSTSVNKTTKVGKQKVWKGLLLSISQKDRRLLTRIQERHGGRITSFCVSSGVQQWRMYGKAALKLLAEMYPYLSPQKKEQADNVLERLELVLPPAPLAGVHFIQCELVGGNFPEHSGLLAIAGAAGAVPVLARVAESGRGVEFVDLITKEILSQESSQMSLLSEHDRRMSSAFRHDRRMSSAFRGAGHAR